MKPKIRPSFAFVVDGETEIWYLQMLKRNEKKLTITIEPRLAQKKALETQFEQVRMFADTYTKVFWVVDMDTYISEKKRNPKSTKIKDLEGYQSEIPDNVIFIANTPCFEYWVLLHLRQTSRYYDCCDAVIKEIHKYEEFLTYNKKKKYFTQATDIYARLRNKLSIAIENARSLPDIDFNNFDRGTCQMYKIFDALDLH